MLYTALLFDKTIVSRDIVEENKVFTALVDDKVGATLSTIAIHTVFAVDERTATVVVP